MPPKVKIVKEMIVDAGFHIARTEGADKITARSISEQLKCSTQPVLYHFSTVEEIKKAVYQQADEYHTSYLMNMEKDYGNPMLAIGMNYIQFAVEECHLFRFLFQSNEFSGRSMLELLEMEELNPIFDIFQQETETTREQVKEIFLSLFIYVHGYASMLVNNTMPYDDKQLILQLTKAFYGAVYAAKEVTDEENI